MMAIVESSTQSPQLAVLLVAYRRAANLSQIIETCAEAGIKNLYVTIDYPRGTSSESVNDHQSVKNVVLNCAKQFYTTCVYTTEFGANFFNGKVDEIIIIPENFEYVFLGDLKYYVFENETNPYILIDGDLFLESPLILNDNNISVECILPHSIDTGESIFNKIIDKYSKL